MADLAAHNEAWNAYLDRHSNKEPSNAQQLLNFCKNPDNGVSPLSFSTARKVFIKNWGKGRIDVSSSSSSTIPRCSSEPTQNNKSDSTSPPSVNSVHSNSNRPTHKKRKSKLFKFVDVETIHKSPTPPPMIEDETQCAQWPKLPQQNSQSSLSTESPPPQLAQHSKTRSIPIPNMCDSNIDIPILSKSKTDVNNKRTVGKLKGVMTGIDVSKLKPNAWQNRKKAEAINPIPSSSQTLSVSEQDNHHYTKPKIYSRRKRTPNNIILKMAEEESAFDTETTDNEEQMEQIKEVPKEKEEDKKVDFKLYEQQQKALNESKSYNQTLEREYDQSQQSLIGQKKLYDQQQIILTEHKAKIEQQQKRLDENESKLSEWKEIKNEQKKLERVNYEQTQQMKELNLSIEMLKHQKLVLEEWKTEIGLVAVENVSNLENELESATNNSLQLQLQMEGLQTKNDALNQHIETYQDEINKFRTEQPKLEAQINHFEQALKEQYEKTQSLQSKEVELNNLKNEFDALKTSLENANLELKELKKENVEIKGENEQYLTLIDELRESENKLKKQCDEQQNEMNELNEKYNILHNKMQQETAENKQQLEAAEHNLNNLSNQLEEMQKYANSPRAVKSVNGDEKTDSDQPLFGRPLFEKRNTLKIKSFESNSSKLPNMSDMIDSYDGGDSMDEFVAYCSKTNGTKKSKSLPPVNEFADDEDTKEEKLAVNGHMDEDEKAPSHKGMHSHSFSSSTTATFDDEFVPATYSEMNHQNNASSFTEYISSHVNTAEEDKIDKLLRKASGSSYYKFRNGSNAKIDSEQRHKLRSEIVGHIDSVKSELKQKYENNLKEKELLYSKYKRESKQWEEKYKALKREIKKRKLKHAQNKQKSTEGAVDGCKFWSWGFQPEWIANSLPSVGFAAIAPKEGNLKKTKLLVDDDSDEMESSNAFN